MLRSGNNILSYLIALPLGVVKKSHECSPSLNIFFPYRIPNEAKHAFEGTLRSTLWFITYTS